MIQCNRMLKYKVMDKVTDSATSKKKKKLIKEEKTVLCTDQVKLVHGRIPTAVLPNRMVNLRVPQKHRIY
jgi:hypothetical protein